MTEVSTEQGVLRGSATDHGTKFLGIPYAAPPVGALRFRPPAPPTGWDGVRDAAEFGPIAPQNPSMMDAITGAQPEAQGEDCLYLNVWTPDVAGSAPVMVWIHGGGFQIGSGSSPIYNGEAFARDGVVLVSLNYRLGELGFMELGAIDPGYAGSGNNGLRDQIAALEWVRDNIATFGGDPANVTVFGESAGSMSVSLLLASDAVSGLFHRAICESGGVNAASDPDAAHTLAAQYLAGSGVDDVAGLVALSVEELLGVQSKVLMERFEDVEATIEAGGDPLTFLPFRPVTDGDLVPHDPLATIANGSATGIDVLVGYNAEEWNLFALMDASAIDDAALERRLELVSGNGAPLASAYRTVNPDASAKDLLNFAFTDLLFRRPAAQVLAAQEGHGATFAYRFSWQSPSMGGMLGAAHAMELPFVFDLAHAPGIDVLVGPDAPQVLSNAVHGAWVAFAKSGTATLPDGPEWSEWRSDAPNTMDLNELCRPIFDVHDVVDAAWEG
ncbi:carboxylesterase/lipase family protein [Candidatus Microthrix sp.]|jgi:para-nitrobenzyl esterase|uniref:carboxylesterase/lipase family protein n=1 Tax=Candidatus Neomicrothrix sp. TaxID=2719034 RepID=UPI001B46E9CD|nr:carboxylesterase/lipase family protein [Candidatus Microthrix sp.]MBP6133753.1 carboxylesterase/lipase family protein [Candidatus Microthrix sp.]MBP7852864.1 carboxylesterase/lipase family protein [Candidatus Microthrix sp.]MBP9620702.1 carboxylesterase/lipase family protein [Candidatus Microthrix sp.]